MAMIFPALFLMSVALGHTCLLVLAVNVSHGFAHPAERARREADAKDWLVLALLVAIGIATVVVGGWLSGRAWRDWPGVARAYAGVCLAVALVGLPATTLARELRRTPRGVAGRAEEIDLARSAGGAEAFIGLGRRAWCLRLPGHDSFRLRLADWQ